MSRSDPGPNLWVFTAIANHHLRGECVFPGPDNNLPEIAGCLFKNEGETD